MCMDYEHEKLLAELLGKAGYKKPVLCLYIPDEYEYRDPMLMSMIASAYDKALAEEIAMSAPSRTPEPG